MSADRFDHVLVDEYQDTNRLQASILLALKPDGTGLTVVGDDAQSIYSFRAATVRNILDFPGQFTPPRRSRHARPQLPLDAADPCGRQCGDRAGRGALHQEPLDRPRLRRAPATGDRARRSRSGPLCRRAKSWRTARPASRSRQQAVLFRASHHSGPLEIELTRRNIPFVKFGGLKFLEAAHVKDVLALLRWAENPRDRVAGLSRAAAAARRRSGHGAAPARSGHDWRGPDASHWQHSLLRRAAAAHWPAFVRRGRARARQDHWLAGRARPQSAAGTSRIWSASTRTPTLRQADLVQLEQIAAGYPSRERFLTELTLDPPDATSDQAGRAAARRGLSDPLDHPFGQGPGMEIGLRAQRRRRLHPVRSRHRQQRRRSRRSGACSTSR